MDPERWREVEAIYESALRAAPAERAAFLDSACGGDEELRREVESLLACASKADRFLEVPAAAVLATEETSMAGRSVSHYQIQDKLGEGGMGAVYRAYDTQLRRPVALKVLPAEYAADPERRQRLLREARAASALSHPNIVAIYEVGSEGGVDFIAMEFVEGKPLSEAIPAKGLPLPRALDYAAQIAGGLAKAHGAGVIHRDLKPGNIMLTADGLVKLLDFGLARRVQLEPGQETTLTVEGEILGTPAYMSPEQAEGKALDARSDVFSFGVVLYEMLTGRRAFAGDSIAAVLASVLREEPPPPGGKVPREAAKIVERCLRKDPARRLQHLDDVKVELEELKADLESGKPDVAATPGSKRPRRWMWPAGIAAAALLLATVSVLWLRRGTPPRDLRPVALTSHSSGLAGDPSFSPDGNRVAFVWNGEEADKNGIYVEQIGAVGPPMRLTTGGINPAWSPDGQWIAFRRQQKGADAILLIPSVGGLERELDRIPAWNTPFRIPVLSSGSWTADSKWLVFAAQDSPGGPTSIRAISVDTRERRQLTTFRTQSEGAEVVLGDSSASVSPDGRTLTFARQVKTWLFELYALRLTRDLRPDGEPARVTGRSYSAVSGIAWTGDSREIVYGAGPAASFSLWRAPVTGNRVPSRLPYAPQVTGAPAIARTAPRLAYASSTGASSIWRLDTRSGERMKLIEPGGMNMQYSPDGRKISYTSGRSGDIEIWTCDADGSNCVQLTSFENASWPPMTAPPLIGLACGAPRWSPDGRWLTFSCNPEGHIEIYVMPADGGAPRRVTHFDATNNISSFSQDGQWIYFASDRTGRYEIWKTPASGGEAMRVTHSGGYGAFESPDGNLYYNKYPEPSPLFRMPAGGGAEEQVLPRVDHYAAFGVTRKGIYFTPDRRTIQFLDSAANKTVTLAADIPVGRFLCVSPDGTYALTSQNDRRATNLMLVEGFR